MRVLVVAMKKNAPKSENPFHPEIHLDVESEEIKSSGRLDEWRKKLVEDAGLQRNRAQIERAAQRYAESAESAKIEVASTAQTDENTTTSDTARWGSSIIKVAKFKVQHAKRPTKKRTKKRKEVLSMSDEHEHQDCGDIKSALVVHLIRGRTYLIAVVGDSGDPETESCSQNTRQRVRCHHGHAFSEGYTYDQASDSYLIPCIEHLALGFVPVAYEVRMPGTGDWHVQVPLPEVVVERYLTGLQKSKIGDLQGRYSHSRYVVQIMQMSGCEV